MILKTQSEYSGLRPDTSSLVWTLASITLKGLQSDNFKFSVFILVQ